PPPPPDTSRRDCANAFPRSPAKPVAPSPASAWWHCGQNNPVRLPPSENRAEKSGQLHQQAKPKGTAQVVRRPHLDALLKVIFQHGRRPRGKILTEHHRRDFKVQPHRTVVQVRRADG